MKSHVSRSSLTGWAKLNKKKKKKKNLCPTLENPAKLNRRSELKTTVERAGKKKEERHSEVSHPPWEHMRFSSPLFSVRPSTPPHSLP